MFTSVIYTAYSFWRRYFDWLKSYDLKTGIQSYVTRESLLRGHTGQELGVVGIPATTDKYNKNQWVVYPCLDILVNCFCEWNILNQKQQTWSPDKET